MGWKARAASFSFASIGIAIVARADSAVSWGDNVFGELGNGGTSGSLPVFAVGLSSGVSAVACGNLHSVALQNGSVYAWGSNQYGQIGDGVITGSAFAGDVNLPVPVVNLSTGVTAIAAGMNHCLAIQNGAVYAWGDNSYGQLGDISFVSSSATPVATFTLSRGVTAISANGYQSLAIANGTVWQWGSFLDGDDSGLPVPLSGFPAPVTAIAAGGDLDLALSNGGVYAWGYNQYGQLGNGTTTANLRPAAVTNLSSGVTAIAAGDFHALAVKNGGVYAWGDNYSGELGNGTTTQSDVPVQVDPTDLKNIVAVAAGYYISFALSSDGSIWDWGLNENGDLGFGTWEASYLTPQHLLPPAGYRFTSIQAEAVNEYETHVIAMLVQIPEPSSLLLLALGGIGLLRRRPARCMSIRGNRAAADGQRNGENEKARI